MNKQLILFLVIFSNLEGDYINKNKNDCKYICNRCFLTTYIDLKKYLSRLLSEIFLMESCCCKKKIKVINSIKKDQKNRF